MPIKNHTRHEANPPKKGTAKGLFVQRESSGEKPQKGLLDYALKISSQHRGVGGKKTLTR